MFRIVKNIILGIVFMVLFLHCFVCFLNFTDDGYGSGRDTEKSFGNGRYQIIRFPKDENGNVKNALIDVKESETIEPFIYHEKEIDSIIYVKGEIGYTLLDYQNEIYWQSDVLQDFTTEEQAIFNQFKYEITN